MGMNLSKKIIKSNLVKDAKMVAGEEIYLKMDHTLTRDITAVMAYLAFEALGIPKVRTECSVSYLDHNLLYVDNKTPDDYIFLQSIAKNTGCICRDPEVEYAILFIMQGLVFRERQLSDRTAIPLIAE